MGRDDTPLLRRIIKNRPGDHVRLPLSRYGHLVIPIGRRWLVRLYFGRPRYCIVRRFSNLTTERSICLGLPPSQRGRQASSYLSPSRSPRASRTSAMRESTTNAAIHELRSVLQRAVEIVHEIETNKE